MPADGVQAFQQAVQALNQHGICVGLCSDSPLPQLQQLAGELGLTGPIVAENGNVVSYNDQTVAVNELPGIAIFKQHVAELASRQELKQSPDFIAPEFGGQPVAPGSWGFGADRIASVSVSGPAPFIEALGQHFASWPGISVDCSPEYNFLAIHPGPDFTQGKANTLQLLAQHGCGVVMVGNSMSDWAGPNSGVLSTFVGRARISPGVQSHSAYVSSQPLLAGVVDILNHLVDGAEGAKP